MKPCMLPSGRQRGIPFLLPDNWTPQQALAVVELLDDLRDRICAHYQIPLHDLLRDQRRLLDLPEDSPAGTGDPPF